MKRNILLLFLLIVLMLAACQPESSIPPTPTRTPRPDPVATEEPTEPPTATPALMPTPTLTGPIGPADYPADINPLTGLVVDDPAVLERAPLLIKISNSPTVVRPQSGLNSADHVWEHYMEGLRIATRYTAVFLGNTPDYVGSVRSGRLPDFQLVPMYAGIYFASGFSSNRNNPSSPPRVGELMREADWIDQNFSYEFGYREPYGVRLELEGIDLEHTLFAVPEALWQLAEERGIKASETLDPGLAFDNTAPSGGIVTTEAEVNYPGAGADNTWLYDEASGKWLKWIDGQVHKDRLTDEQVAFSNVVVVYVEHFIADFIETEPSWYGVGIELVGSGDAILLRDGMRYEVVWRRPAANRMIQFFDKNGEVIPFKPGNTWFHLASTGQEPPEVTFTGE